MCNKILNLCSLKMPIFWLKIQVVNCQANLIIHNPCQIQAQVYPKQERNKEAEL